jgi:ABC-type multidrug transport system ATPase subunit
MDQKLKNYSSGMQVRLAFSIAIKAKNEILVFDEVLAVGDEAFQRKCLDTFEQYKADGQTVVLVTHDMSTVKQFCNRAVLIDSGKIIEIGNPRAVADRYSNLNQVSINSGIESDNNRSQTAKYLKAEILDKDRIKKQSFILGETAIFNISWDGLSPENLESIGVNIFKRSGEHITGFNTRYSEHSRGWKDKNSIELEVKLDIVPGSYYLLIEAFKKEGRVEDTIINGPRFIVQNQDMRWSGLVSLTHKWH